MVQMGGVQLPSPLALEFQKNMEKGHGVGSSGKSQEQVVAGFDTEFLQRFLDCIC
jgi:hypothetical protein